ncbi:MAG: GGDEF domain-containing protein [Paenacidovorax caeni]
MSRLLESMALTDGLTGVPNRRAFMARLDEEVGRLRAGTVASSVLLMLDIDHFKRVNDTYGHSAGDAVLKHLAAVITQALRKGDMVGRLGGEEFAVLLSDADGAAGYRRAESLREAVAACVVPVDKAGDIRCTVSLGVCAMQRGDASAQDCLARADAALYASKRNGRNQSTVWSQDHSEATSA